MTTMSSFIKAISLLMQDRQEFTMTAIKVKEDMVITIVPNKKSGKVNHFTVPSADLEDDGLDAKVIELIGTPVTEKVAFSTTTGEIEPEEEEENEGKGNEGGNSGNDAKKEEGKKPAGKGKAKAPKNEKAPKGKGRGKKVEAPDENETPEAGQLTPQPPVQGPEDTTTDQPAAEGSANQLTLEEELALEVKAQTIEEATNSGEVDQEAVQEAVEEAEEVQVVTENKEEEPIKPSEPNPNAVMFASFMEDGHKAFAEGKYLEAAVSFKEALSLYPDNEEANREMIKAEKWASAYAKVKSTN